MAVRLVPITKDNWREAIRLKVREDQKGFVATNVYSIAEASFYPDQVHCRAVYDDDTMVGFVMYGYDDEDYGGYAIIRLMVDERYQGKGYGRAAMLAMIEALKQQPDCDKIYISFEPENHAARAVHQPGLCVRRADC
jgi:diamine N-acetyltransferase